MTGPSSSTILARPARGDARLPRPVNDPELLESWREDAAHYPGGRVEELFFPETEGEVAAILARGRPCLAVGAQSSLTGGATPRGETLISLARMNAIEREGPARVRCGAGVILADLGRTLREVGGYYPPVPTYDGATVGGNVATNAAGAATFRHGTTRDWVEALTVVTAWGEVLDIQRGSCRADDEGFRIASPLRGEVRIPVPRARRVAVRKNSSGYFGAPGMDLIDLFVGAEGTLGVVTEVGLRIVTPRPAWFVALVATEDDSQAVALTRALRELSEGPAPVAVSAIEYMDRACIELLLDDGADRRLGVAIDRRAGALLLVQVELPPDADAAGAFDALAGGAGDRGPLARLVALLEDFALLDRTVPVLPGEDARRDAVFALREAVPEGVGRRIAEARRVSGEPVSKSGGDVVVPFERFGEALTRYRRILDEAGLRHATWGHISDGNVHPNIMARNQAEMDVARRAQVEIGKAAIELSGAPMSEHGVGRNPVKQQLLALFQGADGIASMRAVRRALDPDGLLAPGVLWPKEEGR
jgi:D-lactate dehydrogenase (cytochrome)